MYTTRPLLVVWKFISNVYNYIHLNISNGTFIRVLLQIRLRIHSICLHRRFLQTVFLQYTQCFQNLTKYQDALSHENSKPRDIVPELSDRTKIWQVLWQMCCCKSQCDAIVSWWCHQMETISTLLAICAGNSPVHRWIPHAKASKAEL